MIEIRHTLVSLDVIEKTFSCNLKVCKGYCCVEGVSGAPLEEEETKILEQIYPAVRSFLSKKSLQVLQKEGLFVTDSDGDKVTPLVEGRECAYVVYDRGIASCAIEKAYLQGLISFRKPVSCHLYPIRIDKYEKYEAVNYHQWKFCNSARENPQAVPLYVFLKEALIRKYGEEWYRELCLVAREYSQHKMSGAKK